MKPPEYAALINPIACNAFAMRYVGRRDIAEAIVLDTRKDRGGKSPSLSFDFTVQVSITEALMFVAPFVKLTVPVKADYAGAFLAARLTVTIDGLKIVDKELLERYLVAPACRFSNPEHQENPLVFVGRDEDCLLGACTLSFLTNGSRIQMWIDDIPSGAGMVRVLCGAVAALYTTKAKEGLLYEVGILDKEQTVSPIERSWPEPPGQKGTQLTQDRLENAYGTALKSLLDEKERELRRMKEDAALKEKAAQSGDTRDAEVPESSLDETLARARRRLVRWGLIAMLVFLGIALGILWFAGLK